MFQWLLMFKPYWNKYGQPGSQVNLNSDIVGNQSVAFPTTSEQERIANFFSELDTAITLHEKKRQQLERFKRALLQKMFAYKIGYPKLRFNRFSNKWITINLGNMLIQSMQKNKGYSYPVFTSSRQGLVRQIEHFGSNQHHDTADYNANFPEQSNSSPLRKGPKPAKILYF